MTLPEAQVYKHINEAVAYIKSHFSLTPRVGLVLGSGLGDIADAVVDPVILSYADIPYFIPTAVQGHAGRMILGHWNDVPVVILQGRFHFYEGHAMSDVVFPTRTLCGLGIHSLILTNAAGGINTKFRAGDLMLIEDHLNLMGQNPLSGPNLSKFGPRFPDMSEPYNKKLFTLLKATADELKIPVHSGVYSGLPGPAYETPAEVRMLRVLGADAVGMSTVPECIAANHSGVSVCGISTITNLAAGLTSHSLSHQEVLEYSKLSALRIRELLTSFLPKI